MIDSRYVRYRPKPAANPFRQFILKMHGRCNLSCRYCYLYTKSDQRWRHRPAAMPARTIDVTAARIAEHARAHDLDRVDVVLHGGEPLLAGAGALRHAVTAVRREVGETADVRFSLQTNGTLLNRRYLRLFDELDVAVGVSLDGEAAAHDRNRADHRGGSHARVSRGLAELTRPEFRHLFQGLLCVIDLEQAPLSAYAALLAFDPPAIDLLLPHANWSAPPAGPPGAYAEWLTPIFDHWFGAPVRRTRIRLFEEMINVLLGGESAVESVGTTPIGMLVVETDGAIEQSDILAATYEGAADLGLNVFHDDFDSALRHPGIAGRQRGVRGIPSCCRPCRWAEVCGGGQYAHRYRGESGFDHRSVYCTDLDLLFQHIHRTLTNEIAALSAPFAVQYSPGCHLVLGKDAAQRKLSGRSGSPPL
ncbi:FxsB family cyclophane-forming radical SAM/SPASM peptide maturase [Actinomadura fibrosa]|uniref:FxsB family cyclophane-forming radical SAM/SPASM peptide maturase n=1 Tax=Actinomadura fibrosa TaxID=111802 RepID=A0ABW2XQ57_9ACTN|nr:FxsB family cyclophane-forming radical SAM/SPASM peptide maturase [Actinomadura fibrosa]